MEALHVYNGDKKIIAPSLIILKKNKFKIKGTIHKKFINMNDEFETIIDGVGVWKFRYEALRFMGWTLIDR